MTGYPTEAVPDPRLTFLERLGGGKPLFYAVLSDLSDLSDHKPRLRERQFTKTCFPMNSHNHGEHTPPLAMHFTYTS